MRPRSPQWGRAQDAVMPPTRADARGAFAYPRPALAQAWSARPDHPLAETPLRAPGTPIVRCVVAEGRRAGRRAGRMGREGGEGEIPVLSPLSALYLPSPPGCTIVTTRHGWTAGARRERHCRRGNEPPPAQTSATVEERTELEDLVKAGRTRLRELERKALLTSDPIERSHLREEIEALQRTLFDQNSRLDLLRLGGSSGPAKTASPRVFVSYSHADQRWVDRLKRHLRSILPAGSLEVWNDTRIKPGTLWRQEIADVLDSCRIVVLLVSADFLASEYVANEELPLILQKAQTGEMRVLPIILSPCAFDRTRLARFQPVNAPSSPMTSKSKTEQEMILSHVADSIGRYLATQTP